MKLGLDFHGVCDTHPEIYGPMTRALLCQSDQLTDNNEVHIITGGQRSLEVTSELARWGIHYTHFFSIVDYHTDQEDTKVWYDESGHPWMDDDIWNPTKSNYCERYGIDLMIDDSPIYGSYFTGKTVYMLQRDPSKQEVWMQLAGRK